MTGATLRATGVVIVAIGAFILLIVKMQLPDPVRQQYLDVQRLNGPCQNGWNTWRSCK